MKRRKEGNDARKGGGMEAEIDSLCVSLSCVCKRELERAEVNRAAS